MKKVLIITYYWPPAGGPGVQRVLKFAKYLPQFGWEPIILTVDNGEYPARDESLLKDIPQGIKVYKTKTLEPFALYKSLTGGKDKAIETYALTERSESILSRASKWVRLNLFIPDARVGWKKYAVRKAKEIIKEEGIDAILSSSPPHSLQMAAQTIAKDTGIPWMADFRDLWLDAFYIPTEEQGKRARRLNAKYEKSILKSADKIVSTSLEIIDDFKGKVPNKDYAVVYNGYDNDDFHGSGKVTTAVFTIRYFGSIASGQNPLALFEALKAMAKEHGDSYKYITVELYGKIDATVRRAIIDYNLEDKVVYKGYIPHSEVAQLMSTSDCLLLLLPRTKYKGMVPGKLFEYMATGKPILALGDVASESADLLRQTNSGQMYDHKADILESLVALYDGWKDVRSSDLSTDIEEFTRENQTKKLSHLLDELTL